jgi:hypothetical protein
LVDERFETESNCQSEKLLGHENCRLAGETREIDSVGETAWAANAIANTQDERKKDFTPQAVGLGNWCLRL